MPIAESRQLLDRLRCYRYRSPTPGTPKAKAAAEALQHPGHYEKIPPELRRVVASHSKFCASCDRFTRRGGGCPGVASKKCDRNQEPVTRRQGEKANDFIAPAASRSAASLPPACYENRQADRYGSLVVRRLCEREK